ncbi:hypothetical protein [Trichoplusia ni single nucleopolyhedrovirus]|uniref:Uncharacterized protein n=1 Tax=Trichoplusia ni single nucleopolyhedrovirus TaxID=332054 RepID=Q461Z9_9ABAC|nr:hypothetical protein TNSV_gp066 [Trichoplusia ni single nucleopolyhedrovirus]AAZ67437.1 hypothetical protein [Trichoplusia ni single nucleopolyhedrovirus]
MSQSHPSTNVNHLHTYYNENRVPLKSTTLHDKNIRNEDYQQIIVCRQILNFLQSNEIMPSEDDLLSGEDDPLSNEDDLLSDENNPLSGNNDNTSENI